MSNDPDLIYRLVTCPECQGSGEQEEFDGWYTESCDQCQGTGEIEVQRES